MKKILIIAALLGVSYLGHAQVGIGTMTPNGSSILDVSSPDKGVLFPRVELIDLGNFAPMKDVNGSQAKAKGLIVYNIKVDAAKELVEGFYTWNGTAWNKLATLQDAKDGSKDNTAIVNEVVNNFFNTTVVDGNVKGGTSALLYDFEKAEFYTVTIDPKTGKITKVKADVTKGIRAVESKTSIKRGEVVTDATKPATVDVLTLDATKLKKGQIFYEYLAEDDASGKPVVHYINMTNDVYTSINNNEDIKNLINNNVSQYLSKGGNVYYGDHDNDPATKDVLYYKDKNDKNQIIDIGETIKEFFTKSKEEIIKEIREGLGYNITSEVVSTGNKLNGKVIYTYYGSTTIKDLDAQTSGVAIPAAYAGKAIEVYDVKLVKPNGQLEKVGVTDVEVANGTINFALGNGIFYVTLPGGTYKVVVQFVEK
ncbi:MAG: hypothetical protein LBE34_04245 [Flavobacteriaceae bacterium]|jgi:hypothetical protein|nr:hypothetical protein [Flavobacteriaceae bacterium]